MSSQMRRFWAYLSKNETAKGLFLVGVILLAAIGVWGAVRLALNTEYPVLVVSSESMCESFHNPSTNECTLPVGALIVIRGQDPRTITAGPPCNQVITGQKYGSIIVFRSDPNRPDYLVVHRIRNIINSSGALSFQTKGDANQGASCDPWTIPASRVVGVYQYTIPIPYLGTIILSIRAFMYDENTGQPRPQGVAVIAALIVALFAFEVIEPSKKKKAPTPPAPPSPVVQPKPEPEKPPGPEAS